MTDFLMRLAERTLNTFPLVQPAIASLYDPLPVIPSFNNRPDAENAEKRTHRSNLDANGFDINTELLEPQGEREKEPGFAMEMRELNQSATTDFSGAKNESFRGSVSTNSVPEKLEVAGESDRLIESAIALTPEAVKSDSVSFSSSLSALASEIPTPSANPMLSESKTVNLKVSKENVRSVLEEAETKVDRANQHLTAKTLTPSQPPFLREAGGLGFPNSPTVSAKETPEKYSSAPLTDVASDLASPLPLRSEIFPKNFEIPNDRALVASPSALEVKIQPAPRPVPPTVRVNIGRIEVRAIPAPAKPPKESRSPPTPKLSLAEYLRSQGGQS
ncbi:MAG TPA: hypothetical protein V6D28_23190 [Leptolyngbyaceae cyanobacterium]